MEILGHQNAPYDFEMELGSQFVQGSHQLEPKGSRPASARRVRRDPR